MNTPIWVTLWTVVVTIAWQSTSLAAQAQLSGTPKELREFLYPRPHTVNITGEAELHAYKDVATVNLLITTEDRDLSVAMSQNQSLRDTLIDGFTAAGIPERGNQQRAFLQRAAIRPAWAQSECL